MAKLKNRDNRNSTASSKSPPAYLDAVDADPEVTEAWQRVAERLKRLFPCLTGSDLSPRGDPRRRFCCEDANLTQLKGEYHLRRREAMKKYIHLRGR